MKFVKVLIFIGLILAVVWAGKGIFKYNVFSTHDGDHHFARSFDAVKTITEGHFPLRWAGSLNYGCGVPIYNFFYPLIYYLVILLNFLTHDIFLALKLIDFGSLLIGTLFFYLWMKKETRQVGGQANSELPAIGSALLYLFAPYRFSLIFVRGSPEFLAYAILPVVLYLYAKLMESEGRRMVFYAFVTAIAGGLLTISHNFTVMFLMPIILLYLVVKILLNKTPLKKIIWIALSFISAFGFGAFFIGPALLEQKYTQIGQNFLQWREHFPTLGQLIKSKWGYFYSSLGTANDGMSFMLGYAHWVVLGLVLLWFIFLFVKNRRNIREVLVKNIWTVLFFVLSLGTIYLILPISIPVWEKIKLLQDIQFSWRLLGIAIFTISALFGFWLASIKNKKIVWIIFIAISALAVYGNRNHLLPQPISVDDLYRYDDFEKLHPHRFSTTTLGDDVIAKNADKACWFSDYVVEGENEKSREAGSGSARIIPQEIVSKGNTFGFVKFKGYEKVILNLGYFPGAYEIYVSGKKVEYSDCQGRVCLEKEALRQDGYNFISWKIVQTPIQKTFNYLTLGFFVFWLLMLIPKKDNRKFFALVIAFLVFAFFRFYRLDERIGFGWDQERDAQTVKEILSGNLTLIGPRVIGPSGFYLPPYFFYLLAPFYALTNLHPTATINFLVFVNSVFFILSYAILKKIVDFKVALIALLIWAVNPFAVSMDTIAWNPVVIPLLSFVLFYFLWKYYQTKKMLFVFLSSLIFGLGISFHFQFIMYAPIFLPVLGRPVKKLAVLFLGTVIPFIPIVLFDLRHNFLNLKLLTDFGAAKTGSVGLAFLPVIERVGILMSGISGSALFGGFVIVAIGVLLIYISFKERKRMWYGFSLVWILSPILFSFFKDRPSEYYFNYLLPIAVIGVGYAISKLKKVWLYVALTIVTVGLGLKSLEYLKWTDNFGVLAKDRAVSTLKNLTQNSQPYYISFDVPLNEDTGYRYLLKLYGFDYPGNPQNTLIEFVVPLENAPQAFKVGQIGLNFSEELKKQNWLNSK